MPVLIFILVSTIYIDTMFKGAIGFGAKRRTRTSDALLFKRPLYLPSYLGIYLLHAVIVLYNIYFVK